MNRRRAEKLQKLESQIGNAVMIYNNGVKPSLVWSGEQGNENEHSLFADFRLTKGKYGIVTAYVRKDLISNLYNSRRWSYYIKDKNIKLLKQMQISEQLRNDIESNISNEQECKVIKDKLLKDGVYFVSDDYEYLRSDCIQESVLNQIEFTSVPKWRVSHYQVLLKYFMNSNLTKYNDLLPRQHLVKINEQFFHKYEEVFLEERCNSLGFFFKPKSVHAK